ncbi:histidine phosphatase family protein [Streptomyces diastatochromogenes]|uniref:histidine phosphatase family protein n=1 Tax=Streptomyces diastatochromogenes TaxID=42236 RepID=UPI0036A6A8EF
MTIRLTFLCAPGDDAALDPFLGDAPLSDRSLCEARVAGAGLPSHGLVVRAPSFRCSQTAEALGLDAASEPALRDLDLGIWRGHSVGDVAATDPDGFTAWLTDPDAAPHEGESVRRLCRRVATWLSDVGPGTGHVLAITEAAVVRAALIHALSVPARAFWHVSVPHLATVSLMWRGGIWDVRLGHAPAPAAGRWPAPRSATPVPAPGDRLVSAHVGGGERSSSAQEAIFASRG